MVDPRINREQVLGIIYSRRHHRRLIWTPSTTLAAMGIERYPHDPPLNYRRMKHVLAGMCNDGLLAKRPHPHSHFTLKEVAYERADSASVREVAGATQATTNDQ